MADQPPAHEHQSNPAAFPRVTVSITESDDHAVTWADHLRFARGSK
jgi:hypothetical protein